MDRTKVRTVKFNNYSVEVLQALCKENKTTLVGVAALSLGGAFALSRVEVYRWIPLVVGVAPAPLYLGWVFYRTSREEREQLVSLAFDKRLSIVAE